MNYDMVAHYANFRKEVVSDVPEDICLDGINLNVDEKDNIIKGLTLLRACIVSTYDSIIEYAKDQPKEDAVNKTSHIIMKERRDAIAYINRTLLSLYSITLNGEYVDDNVISISKDCLTKMLLPQRTPVIKFQQYCLEHYEYFCRIEYLKNGAQSDWKKCDTVYLVFESSELCYTLRHLIKSGVNALNFQYGDFRIYSKAGQAEDKQNRFPESVRFKALGEENYAFYKTLCLKLQETLDIEQTGENPHQGCAYFQILCDFGDIARYKNTYENTRIGLCIQKGKLTSEIRLGFEAFSKLPEIIEQLSDNAKKAFFSLRQCQSPACTHRCTNKRFAIFDESIFPDKVLKPCQYSCASCNIESEDDVRSVILIYEHIKKYTIRVN